MFATTVVRSCRRAVFGILILALILTQADAASAREPGSQPGLQIDSYAIVFVSRQIPNNGSVYMGASETGSMPGVGPYSRFQVAGPGKLIVREANGTLRTLVDGSRPTSASLNLIDVNAPDVSFDGRRIVFAGLVGGSYDTSPLTNPGAWRIYTINVDGTGLRQVTFSDRDNLDLSQFRGIADLFKKYDDTDPVWLPDGRIVLSSTRWPAFGQYGGVRASNLYVVNADGSSLHRITSERSGADRPLVDPLTGRIVYSRWWRNFRVATNSMSTIANPSGGYIQKDGLLSIIHSQPPPNENEVGGFKNLERNTWHLASINPDGTGLMQWGGKSSSYFNGQISNHAYGGGFAPDGTLYANFFPMNNMTEAAGFGGIRRYKRGPNGYVSIIGVTDRNDSLYPLVRSSPPSHGIYKSDYAAEPEVLPDGRLLISLARDVSQDYGLFIVNPDGSSLVPLYDNAGTTELRARVIRTRQAPVIADRITQTASLLPPRDTGPYDVDGTFTYQALNIYFNAPVDTNILSAMPVGAASSIRFFIDHQRWQQSGSHESLDWPILLQELPVGADGSITTNSPANVPLFEQIRSARPGYTVPLTGKNKLPTELGGAVHVAGMNFGRPGEVVKCVGCHAGHSMIPVPSAEEAKWTNLAPGAALQFSSLDALLPNGNGLTDRRVKMAYPEKLHKYWISRSGQDPNTQWVQLTFPVPVTVRTVRLYNIPAADSPIKVQAATVELYSDAGGTNLVGSNTSGALSESGTNVTFNDIPATVVRVEMNSVSGSAAALAEVEVIARAGGSTTSPPTITVIPSGTLTAATPTFTFTPTAVNAVTATSTFTFTPTAVNARTATPAASTQTLTATAVGGPSSTSAVIPSPTMIVLSSPTSLVTATLPVIPSPTMMVRSSPTTVSAGTLPPAGPTTDPGATTFPPGALSSQRGTTAGQPASLGTLKLSGMDDNPAEYVAFKPQDGRYAGYQSFYLPAGTPVSSISGMTLQVNFKGTAPSRQNWTWAVYDWAANKWVKIGSAAGRNKDVWELLKYDIRLQPAYISSGREVRIQLRSNNASGEARLDYEVLQLTIDSSPSFSQALPLPSTTQPAPASLTPSVTVTPQE